ncbi:MAG: hypothetical protein RL375_2396 [Pseudomonadota bacterium]|jgi:hypothetical protein
MTLDLSNWNTWWAVVQAAAIVALWLRKPGETAGEAVIVLRQDVARDAGALKGRIDVLEERVRHMPTTEELRKVEGELLAIKAQINGLEDDVKSTRSGVARIEDFLRNSK